MTTVCFVKRAAVSAWDDLNRECQQLRMLLRKVMISALCLISSRQERGDELSLTSILNASIVYVVFCLSRGCLPENRRML